MEMGKISNLALKKNNLLFFLNFGQGLYAPYSLLDHIQICPNRSFYESSFLIKFALNAIKALDQGN